MAWRVAYSLVTLINQVNALYPRRNKASDGTIGDASHAAGQSDHNPNPAGIVTAWDVTHDPANGPDVQKLFDALIASRDPRIKYLIFNRRIMVPTWSSGWSWVPYTGDNPHTSHGHISVWGDKADQTSKWSIGEVMYQGKTAEQHAKEAAHNMAVAEARAKLLAQVAQAAGVNPNKPIEQREVDEIVANIAAKNKKVAELDQLDADGRLLVRQLVLAMKEANK